MQAAVRERWGPPRKVVELRRLPKPEPAGDQVLVRVRAASVNRVDYYSCGGGGLLVRPMMGGIVKPKTRELGNDFAGVVEAVGKGIDGFAPGDEVFGARSGAFGEYVAARVLTHKPPNVSFEEAACVPLSGLTALQGLRDAGGLQPGQSVLVNGASGAVGTLTVSIAKALGAGTVTGVCRTRNVEQTRALGADRVVDYTQEDFTTLGDRYDILFDISGTRSWREMRRALTPTGRVVIVGTQKSGNPVTGPLGHIVATKLAGRKRALSFVAKFDQQDLEVLRTYLESGQLKPVIERAYPLAQVVDALEYMGEGHARAKLVVTP